MKSNVNKSLKTSNPKTKLKKMTLIIGARCKDGVVLIADRRIVEGTDIAVQDKITKLPSGVVIAGAGVGEVIDKFNERVPFLFEDRQQSNYEELKKQNNNIKIEEVLPYFRHHEFLDDCEGLLFNLYETYKKHIAVLVATSSFPYAQLSYIDTENFLDSKRRTYIAIGSGSPYANLLLKKLWNKNLTMREMGRIGKFIINYVADSEVDGYVGGGTQIVYIRDLPPEYPNFRAQEKLLAVIPQEDVFDDGFDDKKLIHELNDFLKQIPEKVKEK